MYNAVDFLIVRNVWRGLPVWSIDGCFYELPFNCTCKALDGGASGTFGIRNELFFVLLHRDRRTKSATHLLEKMIYGPDIFSLHDHLK
jgi:hypothetical protein